MVNIAQMVSGMTNTGSTTRPADHYAATVSNKRQQKMTGVFDWSANTHMEGKL